MRRFAAILALVLAALAAAPGAGAGTPEQDLAWLNAKRASSGIPGDITLNADWSAQCAQHLAYMKATGTVSHAEDPANPSYTTTGNWAGTHAVLAAGLTWTESDFIWESAPLHLAQLLAPQLAATGIADDGQSVCVTTWPGYTRALPATDTVVTYPGNGTSIYASEISAESPITPSQALGLSGPTGPHLYVYQWGPALLTGVTPDGRPIHISAATLTGPDGPVAVKWADTMNPVVGRYLTDASGIIIPVAPLTANAVYYASVAFSNGISYSWGFTTRVNPESLALRNVRFGIRRTSRSRTCTHRHGQRCVRWRTRYVAAIEMHGRYVNDDADADAEDGASSVGATFNAVQRPQAPIGADGRFHAIYTLISRSRRFTLSVILTAGDDVAAFRLRIRISSDGKHPTAQVFGVQRLPAGRLAGAPGVRIPPPARQP